MLVYIRDLIVLYHPGYIYIKRPIMNLAVTNPKSSTNLLVFYSVVLYVLNYVIICVKL